MSSLRTALDLPALRHRNYRLFFAGQGLSLIGTWMTAVAQSWLVLQLTGDPFDLGLINVAQFTPVLILGLFGGVLADALPRRPTMYATQIVAMVVSILLFVLAATHTVEVWHVFALAIVMGIRNSIDMPTRLAFAVEMVGREDIGNAVALNSALFNGARIIGPAIAGLTIAAFGVAPAFLIDAISFLAVLVALVAMDAETLRSKPRTAGLGSPRAVLANLVEGLTYVRRTGIIRLAVIMVGIVGMFAVNFQVLTPPLAATTLGVGAVGYGFLSAAMGVGSLLAALFIAFRGTRPAVMLLGALVLGLAELVIGSTSSYPLDLVLMLCAGAGVILLMATANTTMQLAVPEALRGRVSSVYTTVFAGASPIGALTMGAIASSASAQVAFFVGGAISVLAAGAGLVGYRALERGGGIPARVRASRVREAEDGVTGATDPVPAPEPAKAVPSAPLAAPPAGSARP